MVHGPTGTSVLAAFALAATLIAQDPKAPSPARPPAQSARVAAYDMTVQIDPAQRTVQGSQRIRWRNATTAPTQELWFHLYWNAFRDRDSTFMREAGAAFRGQWRETDFGGIELGEIALVEGERQTALAPEFVQPDDGNAQDATVVRVALPQAVPPGGEITVATRFSCRIPKALRRTGWLPGGGVFLMHWYPILGVLQAGPDGEARWNCHQFHAHTEFFADFSSYTVSATLPSSHVVGATGGNGQARDLGDGRTTHVFEQHDVHNFALVADPDFVRHTRTFGPMRAADDPTGICQAVAARLGVDVATFDLPATEIVLLLHREHDTPAHRERHLRAIEAGLEFFGLRYGPYPYPVVTAVDPGRDVQGRPLGGGMEYPTLFTCGAPLFLHPREPSPEGVTIHEFGHQYWYGLSANNEFEEAWLDEGLNTYSEGRAQWLAYRTEPRLRAGTVVAPAEVDRTSSLLPMAVSPGHGLPEGGVALRSRLPGLWRVPGFDALAAHGFDGTWRPASPLLDLMRRQNAASWHPAVPFEDVWNDRRRLLDARTPDPMVQPGWHHLDRISYVANSYHRPAMLLRTLERMVPGDQWWAFLREFHARARFAHPTTADFQALLRERCGAAVADYFANATGAGATLDYGIHAVEADGPEPHVVIRRTGTMTAAMKVRLSFERGAPEYRTLAADDRGPIWRIDLRDAPGQDRGRLLEVWIDPFELPAGQEEAAWPAGVHLIEQNLLDNAWRRRADPAPARHRFLRALLQAQCELSFGGLIG